MTGAPFWEDKTVVKVVFVFFNLEEKLVLCCIYISEFILILIVSFPRRCGDTKRQIYCVYLTTSRSTIYSNVSVEH